MGMVRSIIAVSAGMVLTGVSAWNTIDDIWQPGQPSKQPSPGNPQPRPQNPQPRPQNPQPRPADPTPDPNNPGAPNNQPERPADRDDAARNANRYLRPFAFQSPDMEGRFNQSTKRLLQMEQRMQKSHEDLLKRLGEARQLSGERQTTALFDVMQQILRENAELQKYLVQSRTAWTGDLDSNDSEEPEAPAETRAPERDPGR
jgi:hypothetical protein